MTIRVVADGADGYRLLSADDAVVGWARGRGVGVTGFESEAAAVRAAIRAHDVLSAWVERQHLHPLPALDHEPARFVHDGAHRWLLVGRIPVARIATGTPYDGAAREHAFEIVLKGEISEGIAIHAALLALRAAHGKIDAADITWASRASAAATSMALAPTTHLDLEGT